MGLEGSVRGLDGGYYLSINKGVWVLYFVVFLYYCSTCNNF